MGLGQFDETVPVGGMYPFVNASGTFDETIAYNNSGPFRIDTLMAASDDVAPNDLAIKLQLFGFNEFTLGVVTVPAGAGSGGVPLFDVFAALGFTPGALVLPFSSQVIAAPVVAIPAGKTVTVFALGGAF